MDAKNSLFTAVFVGIASLGGAYILISYYPEYRKFFPKCIFYELTGIYCPGCGTTRTIFYLGRGDLCQAWRYNPLLLVSLPFLVWWIWRIALNKFWDIPLPSWLSSPGFAIAVTAIFVIYFIGRNLPWWPFCTWAPGYI